jgi:hypothetical protein
MPEVRRAGELPAGESVGGTITLGRIVAAATLLVLLLLLWWRL